jgi:hypothetical protein
MTTDPEYHDQVEKVIELKGGLDQDVVPDADVSDDHVAASVLRIAVLRLDNDVAQIQQQIKDQEDQLDASVDLLEKLSAQRDACERVAFTLSPPRQV